MKIAWFSPLPPSQTDIAHYTNRILPELINHFEVEIFCEQRNYDLGNINVPINHIESFKGMKIKQFDFFIYNIGNNANFHKTIWEISTNYPGIVVLHDEALQHMYAGIYKDNLKNAPKYLQLMEFYYGKDGKEFAKKFWHGKKSTEELAEKYPLTELAFQNALGVVVHTNKLFNKIRYKIPTNLLNLPYASKSKIEREKKNTNKIQFNLVVFGYLGVNRRLEQILLALSQHENRDKFKLTVIGKIWNEEEIREKIKKLRIQKNVHILGFVQEEMLDYQLTCSDLAFNLRYPTMGEASGSQLRIWDHSLPSVVTNIGWYSELPDNSVFKISVENEIEDIKQILTLFLEKTNLFYDVGQQGKIQLEKNYNTKKYVGGLKQFLNNIKR